MVAAVGASLAPAVGVIQEKEASNGDEDSQSKRLRELHRQRKLVPAFHQSECPLHDGAQHVAEHGGAYWLLDTIAIAQRHEKTVAGQEFQVWKLTVREDRSASLVCGDGNDNVVYTQNIEFTDFPLGEITFYFANNVIHLPSEY